MTEKTNVSVRIEGDLLLWVDQQVFERRKRKGRGRTATRTAVITDILARAATGCNFSETEA
jgi:hypothetical protein